MSNQDSEKNGGKPKPSSDPEAGASAVRHEIIPPPGLESALRNAGVDLKDPNVSKALEISLTMMFSGALPLAPPQILREYGNVRPELIDKLIEWTETQSAHRRAMEKLRTEGSEKRLHRSQWIGAIVAIGGMILASWVAQYNTAAAIAIAVVAVGGPTAAIWLAQNTRKQSLPSPKPKETSN